jgi:hypothetical protein
VTAKHFLRIGNVCCGLFRAHHPGAFFRQFFLFARLRIKLCKLFHRCPKKISLSRSRFDAGAVPLQFLLGLSPILPGRANGLRKPAMSTKGIKQFAMCSSVDQCALIMLTVDLDKHAPNLPHQRDTRRLIIDENAGAAIRVLHAAQDDIAFILNGIFAQKIARRMPHGQIEYGGHLPLIRAMADKACIATCAECKRKRIEKNRFARTRLTGKHGQARRKIDIQPFDQDNIADRKMRKHRVAVSPLR